MKCGAGMGAPGRFLADFGAVAAIPMSNGAAEQVETKLVGRYQVKDEEIRVLLDRHWQASDAGDFETEHSIYGDEALLEYPQSGELIRGRKNIQMARTLQPNKKRFVVQRVLGANDLWITEYLLTYDGKPSHTVSIMEFSGGKVAHETQYFADSFAPAVSRAQWVERLPRVPAATPLSRPASGFLRYNAVTLAASILAGTAAGICALLGWPVWAMFLGWVAAFAAGVRLTEVVRSYLCFVAGVGIGAAGTVAVTDLSPFVGPIASGIVVFVMATIIASTRQMPYANIVPNFILGVLGIFAFHSGLFDIAGVKVAAAGAVGTTGVWIASRLQHRIANAQR
jgi:uncharacterized protein DUF1097